jgi:hypothetical protein
MPEIHFSQMIFCRVEEDYSPSRYTGYQTVFKSPELSRQEVELIESRLKRYKPPAGQETVRLQFFQLPNGKFVLTHFALIESDSNIIDRARREGMYLAHCLVLEASELQKSKNNPFFIFDKFNFLTSPHDLVNQYLQGGAKGQANSIVIDSQEFSTIGSQWWGDAAKLYSIAAMAQQSPDKSILLYGRNNDILSFIYVIFHFTLPSMRVNCSFDTCIDNCDIKPGAFCLVGATQKLDDLFVPINVSNNPFDNVGLPIGMENCYLSWLKKSLELYGSDTFYSVSGIQELCDVIEEKAAYQGAEIDERAFSVFLDVNGKYLSRFLSSLFIKITSKDIANVMAIDALMMINKNDLLNIISSQKIPNNIDLIIKTFITRTAPNFNKFEFSGWQNLASYSQNFNNKILKLWLSLITKDEQKRRILLGQLDTFEFNEALQLVGKPFSPLLFLPTRNLKELLSVIRLQHLELNFTEFTELVNLIVASNQPDLLSYLVGPVAKLDNQQLKQVEKTIMKSRNIPPDFNRAIRLRKDVLSKEPKGIKKWLGGK